MGDINIGVIEMAPFMRAKGRGGSVLHSFYTWPFSIQSLFSFFQLSPFPTFFFSTGELLLIGFLKIHAMFSIFRKTKTI